MKDDELKERDFELEKELCELKAKQLEIALDTVQDIGGEDAGSYPDHIKGKISNCSSLLEDIISFYRKAAEADKSEVNFK